MFDAHLNTEPLFGELDELKPILLETPFSFKEYMPQNKSIAFELNSENAWGSIVSQGTLGRGLIDKEFDNKTLEQASLKSIQFLLPSLSRSAMSMGANIQLDGNLEKRKSKPQLGGSRF